MLWVVKRRVIVNQWRKQDSAYKDITRATGFVIFSPVVQMLAIHVAVLSDIFLFQVLAASHSLFSLD